MSSWKGLQHSRKCYCTTKLEEWQFLNLKVNNKYNFVDPESGLLTQKNTQNAHQETLRYSLSSHGFLSG